MEQEYSTADLAEESKFMISPFRSYIMRMVSLKTTISSNSALSRRLPRFHVVYAQTMETFFLPRFSNLHGAATSENKLNSMT